MLLTNQQLSDRGFGCFVKFKVETNFDLFSINIPPEPFGDKDDQTDFHIEHNFFVRKASILESISSCISSGRHQCLIAIGSGLFNGPEPVKQEIADRIYQNLDKVRISPYSYEKLAGTKSPLVVKLRMQCSSTSPTRIQLALDMSTTSHTSQQTCLSSYSYVGL